MNYNLTVNENQLHMISRALEAVARMSLGQPSMCIDYALDNSNGIISRPEHETVKLIEDIIKPNMGLNNKSSYRVGSFDYTDDLISMWEVIRYHFARKNDDNESNWILRATPPRQWGKEPLPTIEPVAPFVVTDNDENYITLVRKDVYNELKEYGIRAVLECERQIVKDLTKRAEQYLHMLKNGMKVVEIHLNESLNLALWNNIDELAFEDLLYVVHEDSGFSVYVFVYIDDIEGSISRIQDIFNATEGLDNRRQEFQDRLFEAYKVL